MIRTILIMVLLTYAMTARALTPAEFDSLVTRLESLPAHQADSLAATLLTDAASLTELEQTARNTIFNPDKPDKINERAYASIARAIAASPLATTTQRALADWEAHAAELNAPGDIASDFNVRLLSGKTSSMHELTAGQPAMLYFYNPDCRHCIEVLKLLHDRPMPAPVLAICVDSTEKRWRDTIGQLPSGWTPVLDITDVQAEDLYIFLATPAIYLIDSNGRVTVKNPSINSLAGQ